MRLNGFKIALPSSSQAKDGAKRLARRVGLDVRRHHAPSSVEARRTRLLAELGTTLVVDVGANVGQYGSMLRSTGYRGRIVSLEPLAEPFVQLSRRCARDAQWEALNLALGAEALTGVMNVSAASASSSLLQEAKSGFDVAAQTRFVGREQVEVARLDDIAGGLLRDVDVSYLKLDVQGYELSALTGAEATLPRISAVEVEVSIAPLYEGQPLYREVLDFLEGRGFSLFSLEPTFVEQVTGRLLQMDAICVRDP